MRKLSEVAKMWLDKLHNFINATAHAELSAAVDRLAAYEDLGTVEELAAMVKAEQKRQQLWHDTANDLPDENGLYYGKKDNTNSMYAVQYKDGIWTLDMHPSQKMNIIRWAYYGAFEEVNNDESGN